MSKKSFPNNLLSDFFDHSPNYKKHRSRSYLKFLWLQKQQQLTQLYNLFYQNFMLKPYKIALANLSIVLVIIFALFSTTLGLVAQAQVNPSTSFSPSPIVDTTRLNDCNLDLRLPRAINETEVQVYSYQDLQDTTKRTQRGWNSSNLDITVSKKGQSSSIGARFNCYKDLGLSYQEIIEKKLNDALSYIPGPKQKVVLNQNVTLDKKSFNFREAKEAHKLKLFDNPEVKNISKIKISSTSIKDLEPSVNDEYLAFEIKQFKYVLEIASSIIDKNGNSSLVSSLEKISEYFDVDYNEKNDLPVSRPIVYDEFGNFPTAELLPYTDYIEDGNWNIKRFSIYFGMYFFAVLAILVLINYLLSKKPTKYSLVTKLRIAISVAGITYLVYLHLIRILSETLGYLYNYSSPILDPLIVSVIMALGVATIMATHKKLTNKSMWVDIGFVALYFLYSIILFSGGMFGYFPEGFGMELVRILGFVLPASFTLLWFSYALYNAYLSIKTINTSEIDTTKIV